MDMILIIVAVIATVRTGMLKIEHLFDYVGAFMACMMLYAILKAPFILVMGGFTFPVSTHLVDQWMSGLIALLLFLLIVNRYEYGKQRWQRK